MPDLLLYAADGKDLEVEKQDSDGTKTVRYLNHRGEVIYESQAGERSFEEKLTLPGSPSDYYNTTLGSLVITDGEILRSLEGVPFYGLALSENGIELFRGADNEMVLASSPRQTWAFFESCAMMVNGEDVLPEEGAWPMAREQHPRTVLARVNRNNYLMLHVPNRQDSHGLSLYQINRFFMRNFETEWVYNLDGGYSTALICKTQEKNARLTRIAPNRQPAADILCITD